MSFSSEVRTEILDNLTLRKKHRLAQGYGLLLCSKRFDADEISMTSETKEVAALYRSTLRDILGKAAGDLTIARTGMGNATRHYAVSLPGREAREAVLCHFAQNGDRISEDFISGEGDAAAFLSGAYLACGSVTDPEKNYMLEFSVYRAGLVEPLSELLAQVVGTPKLALRRDQAVLYFRESENIEDALTAAGAPKSAMELMELKIVRDMRNKVNRVTNCETANIDKTVTASARQVADIEYLILSLGLEGIPQELREVAMKRLENPELSLRELLETLSEPLSRSGLNHRLTRLCRMAEDLRAREARHSQHK